MAVIIGNAANGGWSSVTPKPDTNFVSWTHQFGMGYPSGGDVGDGTRFMFFSTSGSNANAGTLALPKLSPVDGSFNPVGIRDNMPDWWLLKKGDTFSSTGFFLPFSAGSVADPNGYVQLYSNYDSTASNNPPLSDPQTNPPNLPAFNYIPGAGGVFVCQASRGETVCCLGIDFTYPNGNPSSASFSGDSGENFMRLLTCEQSLLVENCRWKFFANGLQFIGPQPPAANIFIRRNRGRRNYGWAFGGGPGGLYEENLCDQSGWSAYTTCTFTNGTTKVTYPAADANHLIPVNDCRIKFYAGSGASLPSAIVENNLYFVVNSGSPTSADFSIASTPGGSAISFGASSGTLRFSCPSREEISSGVFQFQNINGRTHNMYLSGVHFESPIQSFPSNCVLGAYKLLGNIDANSCFDTQARSGGTYFNQLYLNQPNTHNCGAPKGLTYAVTTNYCCVIGGGDVFATMKAAYAFYPMQGSGIDFHHNISAHLLSTTTSTPFFYEIGMDGGVLSHNIQYKAGTLWTSANLRNGGIKTLSLTAISGTPDGRMTTFQGDYPVSSGGGTCVTGISGGAGGTPGTYNNVFFTADGGATYPGLFGTVVVGGGGGVTSVTLTGNSGGSLSYSTGGTTFTELAASVPGLPATWSFVFTPYVVEMQDQTNPGVTPGSGANVYLILISGGVQQLALVDETFVAPPYVSSTADFAGVVATATNGGVKITAGGIDYSTGQVLKPVTLISGPAGKTIADVPSNFRLTVGSYPANTGPFDTGSGTSGGSGTGGGVIWDISTNGAGVTTFSNFRPPPTEVNYNAAGIDYQVSNVLTIANFSGATGMQLTVTAVTHNTDDGTNDFRTTTPNASWPYPDRAQIATTGAGAGYYATIGNPGGYPSTVEGFLDAVDQYQVKGTWRTDLTAAAANSFIRAGFAMADPGGGGGGPTPPQVLMPQICM